jgi:hypothetical protein
MSVELNEQSELETLQNPDLDNVVVATKSVDAIQKLIDRGIDVSKIRGACNETPLHRIACSSEAVLDVDVLHMLVHICGVDLEARDEDGLTCLETADYYGKYDVLFWFINAGASLNTSLLCTHSYYCAICLIAAGANVNAQDVFGKTALYFSVWNYSQSIFYALIAAGADFDAFDRRTFVAVARRGWSLDSKEIDFARHDIAKARLDFVRQRALQVCAGLYSLHLPALLLCEILLFACGPVAPLISFHHWWKIATRVKHFFPSQSPSQ